MVADFHSVTDEPKIEILKPAEKCLRNLESGDYIRYHYNGTLADGTLFDSR